MLMRIFKFGGTSLNSIDNIQQVDRIIDAYQDEKLLIVVSAMGKTTNALEKVLDAFYQGKRETALQLFDVIKKQHITTAKYLLVTEYLSCADQLLDFFTEVEWVLHDKPQQDFDYYYDQIVCVGELLSSCILSHYLEETGVSNVWMDVRDIIRTDANFRDANVDREFTQRQIDEKIRPLIEGGKIVLTQGFIGATDENESTTLGREGSDYSAALFANMLDAEDLTIWKDVESVLNADPREVKDTIPLPELNYAEVIEMAYYGAQVIHPKTIKPLQNKSIPLYVMCFLDPSLPGTVIHHKPVLKLPPIIVIKRNQVMLELRSTDFSFFGEAQSGKLFELFGELSTRPNLTQNGAINMICVFDNHPSKIEKLAAAAAGLFDVQLTTGLSLMTIRHYNEETIEKFTGGKEFLIRQQTRETFQLLYRGD